MSVRQSGVPRTAALPVRLPDRIRFPRSPAGGSRAPPRCDRRRRCAVRHPRPGTAGTGSALPRSRPHTHRDGGDQVGHPADLAFQGAVALRARARECGDPADLGVRAGAVDHRLRGSSDAPGSAEHQHRRIQRARGVVDRVGDTLDRRRLPAQGRGIDLHRPGQQAGVGGDPVALGQHEDVARHHLCRRDGPDLPVPPNLRERWQVATQGFDRAACLAFLDEREQGVQEDHGHDGPCQLRRPGDDGQHRREHEQHGQRLGELAGERSRPGPGGARRPASSGRSAPAAAPPPARTTPRAASSGHGAAGRRARGDRAGRPGRWRPAAAARSVRTRVRLQGRALRALLDDPAVAGVVMTHR